MIEQKTEAVCLKLCCNLMASRGIEMTPDEMQLAALRFADMESLSDAELQRLNKTFYGAMRFDKDFRIDRYRPKQAS